MKKEIIGITVIFSGALLGGCTQKQNETGPPNIIFIMTDDHAYQAISAYGYDLIHTPNLDRLAEEGAIFKQCYVTNSICGPSRAVVLTGKHSHINGMISNINPNLHFDGSQQTFPKIMQENGYQTAIIGKWHLGSTPTGFDHFDILPGQGNYYNPDFINENGRYNTEGYVTSIITDKTIDWIKTASRNEQPFMVKMHHKAPHRNWKAETQYLDLFEDRTFDLPVNFHGDYSGRGAAAREQEMEIGRHLFWGWDLKFEQDPFTGEPTEQRYLEYLERMNEEQITAWRNAYNPRNQAFIESNPTETDILMFKFQRYIRDYLKTIQSVDDSVGELMKFLEENGLDKNTVVIYASDQGFYLGEHGWYDKRFIYEQSFRTPLMIWYPKEIKPGTVVNKLVQNLDFAPTILDYARLEIPEDIQGRSMRELALGKTIPWRDAIYYHYYEYPSVHMVKRHYGIRTDRYKLVHFYYDVDEWELYDLQDDPNEMQSVYHDQAYETIKNEMKKKLAEIREYYGDSKELQESFLPEN